MKETRKAMLMSGIREWTGRFGWVLLVTYWLVFMALVPTAATAAQSGALHRAVKAGDLDGLTKLREELGRTLRKMQPGYVFRDCEQCPEMVVVPAGRFRMGDLSGDGDSDERPVHEVTFASPFVVGKYEVTFAEWDACVDAGGCAHRPEDQRWGRGGHGTRPVINVSWHDAKQYVRWLSDMTGQFYRLLSEAEWEYAARAGSTTKYPWGNDIGTNKANCNGCGQWDSQWDSKRTAPVGSFKANGFGLFDTAGNVWEWVEDCWNDSYSGAPSVGSAWMSGNCRLGVLRGGSWDSDPRSLRSADRVGSNTGFRYLSFGFRVARTLVP